MCNFTIGFVVTAFKEFLWDWIVENEVSMKESVERILRWCVSQVELGPLTLLS